MDAANQRKCSKFTCKTILPPLHIYKWKQCFQHREASRLAMEKKRKNEEEPHCESPTPSQLMDLTINAINHSLPIGGDVSEKENQAPTGNHRDKRRKVRVSAYHLFAFSQSKYEQASHITEYSSARTMFDAMKCMCRQSGKWCFNGMFQMDVDVLSLPVDCIRSVANDIWKITGYRFT